MCRYKITWPRSQAFHEREKAWYTLFAHALNIPNIPRIPSRIRISPCPWCHQLDSSRYMVSSNRLTRRAEAAVWRYLKRAGLTTARLNCRTCPYFSVMYSAHARTVCIYYTRPSFSRRRSGTRLIITLPQSDFLLRNVPSLITCTNQHVTQTKLPVTWVTLRAKWEYTVRVLVYTLGG